MFVQIWQTLFLAGLAANADAYVLKREPLYTGAMGFGVWLVLALGATNVEVARAGTAGPEYAVAVLAAVNAIVSLVVGLKAGTGAYDDEPEQDGLARPTGEWNPRSD